jgi:hypothetical protein
MSYALVIRSYDDPEYRHVVGTRESVEALERIADGVDINLNHDKFYTLIEEVT